MRTERGQRKPGEGEVANESVVTEGEVPVHQPCKREGVLPS